MKKFWLVVLMSLAAIIMGVGAALYGVKNAGQGADFMDSNGSWKVNPVMDLKDAKQRALIAKVGLFALRETEVLYFTAMTDSDGQALSSDHDYVVEGVVPESRYWSYTLYGSDDFLIPNEGKIYGFNQETMSFIPPDRSNPEFSGIAQKTYKMSISKDAKEGNWLPSGDNDQLAITLRLYQPSPEVYQNLTTTPLPTIRKIR